MHSQPAAGASVPAGSVDMSFSYNSRIDRARSRLTLTGPDHSSVSAADRARRPAQRAQTTTELNDTRRLRRALAGAGDRRTYHAWRRALHGHGPLTRGAADRSVRLSVDRHPWPDHYRAVDGARRRAVPCLAGCARSCRSWARPGRTSSAPAYRIAAWSAVALVLCESRDRCAADGGAGRHRRSLDRGHAAARTSPSPAW